MLVEKEVEKEEIQEDRVLCPLLKMVCRKEKCAWWVEERKACAILVIAKNLSEMSNVHNSYL